MVHPPSAVIQVPVIFAAASDQVDTKPDDFETSQVEDEIYDPIEPINRAIFSFNNFADIF